MTPYVRFSVNLATPPTSPDGTPGVKYGVNDGTTVWEMTGLGGSKTGAHFATAEVRLLPPVSPSKIVCVGRNYQKHAAELGNEVPAEPLLFLKPPSSLNGNGDPIVYLGLSQRIDFEGEIGVVIGKRARRVKADEAMDYVFGYTVVNDVTARDLQKKDGQWTRGKGFDTSCCVGPAVVAKEEVDFSALGVRTLVNGQPRQDGSIADLIFPIPVIIEYVSRFMTLEPGDLIATGTPEGVGPVRPGDVIRIEVPGVGVLENVVQQESQ